MQALTEYCRFYNHQATIEENTEGIVDSWKKKSHHRAAGLVVKLLRALVGEKVSEWAKEWFEKNPLRLGAGSDAESLDL